MALVHLVADDEIDPRDREAADSGLEQYGRLLETWRAILNRPGLMSAYLPFLRAVAGPGVLDPRIKELTAAYVGALNGCRYTLSHRATSARGKGISDDDIVAAVSERWDDFDEREQVALMATHQLTTRPTVVPYDLERSPLTRSTKQQLREQFTDEELVELLMSISVWNALARWHRVMEFDLDMPPAPEAVDFSDPASTDAGDPNEGNTK